MTLMVAEAAEAPDVAARQVASTRAVLREAAALLRGGDIPFIATLARGSSDQAAAFAKALFETRVGLPVLSQSPSTGALYHATSSRFKGVPVLAISQSGRSPDLIAAAADARRRGAIVIAIVNDGASPLALEADLVVPLGAGPEVSVAATKTFVASLVAVTHLAALCSNDPALLSAMDAVGDSLAQAAALDWSAAVDLLGEASSLLTLGRGLTLPIAAEAALKLKETSGIHAEAFSSAEVAHGPMTLIDGSRPLLAFAPLDAAAAGFRARIEGFVARGASCVVAGRPMDIPEGACGLPALEGVDPVIASIGYILSFYPVAAALAVSRGRDPDRPPHLAKVTETL